MYTVCWRPHCVCPGAALTPHGCVIISLGPSGASRGFVPPPTTVNMGQVLPPSCHCWSKGNERMDGVCNPGSLQDRSKSTELGDPAESKLKEDLGGGREAEPLQAWMQNAVPTARLGLNNSHCGKLHSKEGRRRAVTRRTPCAKL